MIRLLVMLSLLLILALCSSCSQEKTRVKDNAIKPSPEVYQKVQPVNQVESRSILKIKTGQNSSLILGYTTVSRQKIGELINAHLSEIAGLDTDLNTDEKVELIEFTDSKTYKSPTTKWQISLVFDNDIFDNRDYYYTNGLRLEIAAPFLDNSPLKKILIGIKNPDLDLNGFSVIQNIYTPTNPDTSVILYGDRPFSAVLMLGQFREVYNLDKKLRIKSELNVGVIGPASLGKQVQSSIHEIEPVGWPNQVANDVIINYTMRVDKGLISSPNFELNVLGRASAGTLLNKAGGGMNLRFGNFMPVFRGPFSFFENKNPGGRFQFWFFLEGLVDFVAYDATLQGGMFNRENPYTISSEDISRLVFQASAGFALFYNNIGIEYEHFYLTPEFKGAYHFGWGRLKLVLAF